MLYSVSKSYFKWNKKKLMHQKMTGKCIEKILPTNWKLMQNQNYANTKPHYTNQEPCEALQSHENVPPAGQWHRRDLKSSFPDIYKQVSVYIILRLVFSSTGKSMKYDYKHS